VHYAFLRKFSWIPLEEFLELPIPTFWSLVDKLREESEAEEKAMKKMKTRGRR